MSQISHPLADRPAAAPIENRTDRKLSGRRLRSVREKVIQAFLYFCAAISILTTIGIILSLFQEAIGFFLRPEVTLWQFFTGTTWKPLSNPISPENFGVLPLINGTLIVAVLSAAIALPLGVASAIYLSEYAT